MLSLGQLAIAFCIVFLEANEIEINAISVMFSWQSVGLTFH